MHFLMTESPWQLDRTLLLHRGLLEVEAEMVLMEEVLKVEAVEEGKDEVEVVVEVAVAGIQVDEVAVEREEEEEGLEGEDKGGEKEGKPILEIIRFK
mmetsp:Transcript_32360/g.49490  ORF Transcript_32360/g.49490 Transcript_32360/m.49490 type:complete len:97 (+) Transcript_32360:950-1240(+)